MYRNILLAFDFAKRDFRQRYVGTSLGQFWYILSPVITIFIYSVIFSDFMKMKMNIIDNSYAYSIYLVPGLLAWNSFSTTVLRLNTSIFDKSNLIKKINVPMFSFSLAIAITEFVLLFISMVLAVIFLLIIHQPVTLTFLWILPVMLMQTVFAFSLGVIFSLFAVFFKDLKEAIPIIIQLWFWMTPIVYVKEMIIKKYPSIISFNPLYKFIAIYQDIFLYAKAPTFIQILSIVMIGFITLFVAIFLYKRLISSIKDMI